MAPDTKSSVFGAEWRSKDKAGSSGLYALPGFESVTVLRIQIVTVAQAMELRGRAVRFPARGDGGFKRSAKEEDGGRQGAMDV